MIASAGSPLFSLIGKEKKKKGGGKEKKTDFLKSVVLWSTLFQFVKIPFRSLNGLFQNQKDKSKFEGEGRRVRSPGHSPKIRHYLISFVCGVSLEFHSAGST